ncbi:hypothetical protein DPMN_079659 [Dreissena polymorpha]|uniref:Uncharacterized protein n=1 Tax=Dreissena polymorpha TaxID=45954 RepID=A0A9D3YTI0_DREPO|nr:hypothetical protein DPMN_079659 [Dreissena polymorpha]
MATAIRWSLPSDVTSRYMTSTGTGYRSPVKVRHRSPVKVRHQSTSTGYWSPSIVHRSSCTSHRAPVILGPVRSTVNFGPFWSRFIPVCLAI